LATFSEAAPPAASGESPAGLWQKADKAVKAGDAANAAALFQKYFEKYRGAEQAEEALWQAARHARQVAVNGKSPDWEKARDLFRRYGVEFPKSPRAAEAYFEVGHAHYRLRLYREALIYFKLFFKRYPGAPQVLNDRVRLAQADALMATGKKTQAREIYQSVSESGSDELKARALMGLAEIMADGQDPLGALKVFAVIFEKYPDYHYREPELLRRLGLVYVRLAQEEEARKSLFHYLNLAEKAQDRQEVLFALGESFLRDGNGQTALKLYERVLEDDVGDERLASLARFRRAEYMDSQERKQVKGLPAADLADPEGDEPFLRVITAYPADPVTQDARKGMFNRYLARKDDKGATEMGLSYLRNYKQGGITGEREKFAGRVLIYLGEGFLARKEYDKLYQLYAGEYRHVHGLENGRFLYLVGQALEALSLLDQAGVVYYKAQGLSQGDEDKADLYSRRAGVYLLQKNYPAAERVIRYAQGIYRDSEYQGEFDYLAGRLGEARGRKKEALAFYVKATEALPVPAKIRVYVEARLRMLVASGGYSEGLDFLTLARQKQWLTAEIAQGWYRQLGEGLAGQDAKAAIAAGLAGVEPEMPKDTRAAQQINLLLGDLLRKALEADKARGHLQKAQSGPDELLKKKAASIMNQLEIDSRKKPGRFGR